jgi:hypothetical protein
MGKFAGEWEDSRESILDLYRIAIHVRSGKVL